MTNLSCRLPITRVIVTGERKYVNIYYNSTKKYIKTIMKEDFERDDKNIISDMMIENMKTIITL
jgi:hypothetical protein